MMKLMKNVTINGINYHLMGTAYVPTAPGLILDDKINDYGVAHMKYLQMTHPDDFSKLQDSGLLQDYLARIGCVAKLYIEDRAKKVPIPELSDPDFEEKYLRHNCVIHNATCMAENTYVFHGLHTDVLEGLKKTVASYGNEEKPKAPSFDEWLKDHPNEASCIKKAKDLAHHYYHKDMLQIRPAGMKLTFDEWLAMHPDTQFHIRQVERWAKDRYRKDKTRKRMRECQAELRRKEQN